MDFFRASLLVFLSVLFACDSAAPPDSASQALVLGVLPDRHRAALLEQYAPLVDYLGEATGHTFQLVLHDRYEELLDAFLDGELDLAWFGGLTFVKANEAAGAKPLVMRDTDLRFKSYYLVAGDASWNEVSELRGMRFAFGPRLSTSGHLMPRHFLEAAGIVPESFFASVRYSRAHDDTAFLVRDGAVDAGVANRVVIDTLYAEGQLSPDEVRIADSTPPFHDYVWATRAGLAASVRAALLDAFLALDLDDPTHARILSAQGAAAYLPASRSDFEEVRKAAFTAGLLTPEPGP